MGRINWNSDFLNLKEILMSFLGDIEETDYSYKENPEDNVLEKALFEMAKNHNYNENGLRDLEMLDMKNVYGQRILKLWKLCGEDVDYFNKTVSFISGTRKAEVFTKEEVIKNLDLDNPVPFIPKEDMFNLHAIDERIEAIGESAVYELLFSLRMNLINNVNSYITENNLDIELLQVPEVEQQAKL